MWGKRQKNQDIFKYILTRKPGREVVRHLVNKRILKMFKVDIEAREKVNKLYTERFITKEIDRSGKYNFALPLIKGS